MSLIYYLCVSTKQGMKDAFTTFHTCAHLYIKGKRGIVDADGEVLNCSQDCIMMPQLFIGLHFQKLSNQQYCCTTTALLSLKRCDTIESAIKVLIIQLSHSHFVPSIILDFI